MTGDNMTSRGDWWWRHRVSIKVTYYTIFTAYATWNFVRDGNWQHLLFVPFAGLTEYAMYWYRIWRRRRDHPA